MDVKEQKDQHPADVAAQAIWEASESRFQTPEELDAQFTPPDDDGGYRRHGMGPATVVMALAQGGFRGPINPECLKDLVELAIDRGVRQMVADVYEDTGLTFLPRGKWWSWGKGMLVSAEDIIVAEMRSLPAGWLPTGPLRDAIHRRAVSINQLSREVAERFGTKAASEHRQLERIHTGKSRRVKEPIAERYAAGLGFHLVELYPSWDRGRA